MPRDTNANFRQTKNAAENQPVFLYEIIDYDGQGSNFYFAECDTDIIYQGKTYQKFPISHEFIGENTQGTIDSVRVTISNVSRFIQYYLEQYNAFRGVKVVIKMVWLDKLDDPDAYIEDIYYIDKVTANEYDAEFTLTSKFDILQVELPTRKFHRNYCSWTFKSTECGYTGPETVCDKSLNRCRELQNQVRFGGFPSIPPKPVYIV